MLLATERRARRRPRRVARRLEEAPARRAPVPEDLFRADLSASIAKLASKMRQGLGPLRASWDADDLVQEVYTKALGQLDSFRGGSSLKTWVIALARNHLLSLSRAAAVRPRAGGDLIHEKRAIGDPAKTAELRGATEVLLRWLRENPDEVEHGYEVMLLLFRSHGDYSGVALALTLRTGRGWTVEAVRNVVRAVRNTYRGSALCEAAGLGNTTKTTTGRF